MIPEAAVEAAAKVLYLEDHLWDEPWETTAAAEKYRTNALIALEAAAPHLWEQGAEAGCIYGVEARNPYRIQP